MLSAYTRAFVSRHSPFYANLSFAPSQERGFNDLPLIDRQLVRERGLEFVTKRGVTRWHTIVTGSTTGPPLAVFRSVAEVERCASLGLNKRSARAANDVTVILESGNHGVPTPTTAPNCVVLPIKFASHFKVVLDALNKGVLTPRGLLPVRVLIGGVVALKRLVTYASERGIRDEPANLERVFASGTYLTPTWRARLAEFFRARISTVYGLSEFSQGVAVECAECGLYHFPITVWPEVISTCAERRIGELVLSHLIPFADLQPLLRYKTGDIVRIGDFCHGAGDVGFDFYGRTEAVFDLEAEGLGQGVVPAVCVADVLEGWDGAVYRPDSANFKGIVTDTRLCNAVFRFARSGTRWSLVVERTRAVGPAQHAEARQLGDRILCSVAHRTGQRLGPTLEVSLVGEGVLGDCYVRY
jgi:phenylacetate-coenzyme A ligase PaaK-like adenylate-forming protein